METGSALIDKPWEKDCQVIRGHDRDRLIAAWPRLLRRLGELVLEYRQYAVGDPKELIECHNLNPMQVAVEVAQCALLVSVPVSTYDHARPDLQRITTVLCDDRVTVALDLLDVPHHLP